ncbi:MULTISPECIES: hypothetical protein [unclassified Ruegeria]|uniref:hypothetical protein n=1 Tax=unclassified Ruegeria TaxID=2625375 RepID=UPI001488E6F4|nr:MULTISPECIES: hypothetical protein [unclassified Ruegeria]
MIDLEALSKQLSAEVRKAVEAEAHKLQTTAGLSEMVCAILKKPMINYPSDVQVVLGVGRTTLHHIVKDDDTFPPLSEIGRRQFVNTQKFMDWVASKETGKAA